jgi:D-tyrosyl-tRNA(Tyr) deacylase
MRALIQRVSEASVAVDGAVTGRIGRGFLVLLGVGTEDTGEEAATLAGKVARLRVFEDGDGRMNLALPDVGGAVLAVSQFTLMADTRKGNRPSFIRAARPERAEPVYERFCDELRSLQLPVEKGVFGAHMDVRLVNDGPVTILLET